MLGLIAFSFGTAAGVLFGKLMYVLTGGQVNPLIGSAGVSAVPMAARVSQKVGQSENPSNFLLMHAMSQRGRCYRLCRCCWYPDQHSAKRFLKSIFSARRFARAAGRFLFYDLKCPPRLLWA